MLLHFKQEYDTWFFNSEMNEIKCDAWLNSVEYEVFETSKYHTFLKTINLLKNYIGLKKYI